MIKKLSKNFLFLTFGEGFSHIIGFVANAYIARILNVEGFGLINYCLAYLTYLLLFSNMGLTTLGVREVAKNTSNKRIIGEIVFTRLILTFILFSLFTIFTTLFLGNPLTRKIIMLYLLTAFPNALYLEFVFQAREEMEFIGAGRIIQYSIYFILIFILLKSREDLIYIPISFFCANLLSSLFLLLIFIKKYGILPISPANSYQTLVNALPIGFATIVYQAGINFPPIWLGIIHKEDDVGLFSASFKIILLLLIVERIFYYLFFPIFSQQANQGSTRLKKMFTFFSQLGFAITIFITSIGILFSKKILVMIYGSSFAPAQWILIILFFYFLLAPMNTIWGYGLVALNYEKKFFKVVTITAISNLILSILLGYFFKGIGTALAIFFSEFLGLLLMKKELNAIVKFSLLTIPSRDIIKEILLNKKL
jgi:O-antigen/teichoic acid export membrane protein